MCSDLASHPFWCVVWDLGTGQLVPTLMGHTQDVFYLSVLRGSCLIVRLAVQVKGGGLPVLRRPQNCQRIGRSHHQGLFLRVRVCLWAVILFVLLFLCFLSLCV